MRYQRNADEESRRRARARAAAPTQDMIDRVVLDKLRAGRPGEITLYELQRASTDLIPREVLNRALQDAFDKLWDGGGGVVSMDVQGATLTVYENFDADPLIVVDMETSGLDPQFVFPGGHEIPRLRFYANESSVDTGEHGTWENMW